MLTIGGTLADPDWAAPTECPKWTVKDVYAHLIGGEWWMASGAPKPEQGYEAWAAQPVLARRATLPPALLDELRQVYEHRRTQLEQDSLDPEQPVHGPTGVPLTLGQALRLRVLDVWAHEQDIRRAIGRSGNLASPAAAIAGDVFVGMLPRIVAKEAKAPPGSTVRLTTTGEVTIDVAVAVDSDHKGALVAPAGPATGAEADAPRRSQGAAAERVPGGRLRGAAASGGGEASLGTKRAHLTLGWEAYTRLSCGRGARTDYDVRVAGDRGLGERVLASLAITP